MPNTKTKKTSSRDENASKSQTRGSKSEGNGSQPNSQLEKFFTDQLKDIYWAEKHLTKALPKMKKAATTEELKTAIEEHTAQTEEHVTRLEDIFEMMGKKPQAKKCDGMEGLVKEGESAVEETEEGSMTRDAAIIMSSQKVEHYEISSYGTLVTMARTMGMEEVAEVLEKTLEEEKQTDQNLSELAETGINWEAESEQKGEGDEEE